MNKCFLSHAISRLGVRVNTSTHYDKHLGYTILTLPVG